MIFYQLVDSLLFQSLANCCTILKQLRQYSPFQILFNVLNALINQGLYFTLAGPQNKNPRLNTVWSKYIKKLYSSVDWTVIFFLRFCISVRISSSVLEFIGWCGQIDMIYYIWTLFLCYRMNNKFEKRQPYRSRRKNNISPFSLNLTSHPTNNSSLLYSNTHSKLIQLNKITQQQPMPTAPFLQIQDKPYCKRKDYIDRKFQAIKNVSRSLHNVKIVSPKKVDIVLTDTNDTFQRKREPSIHSIKHFSKKISPQKDMLKEFKLLEQMRRQLRSRNFQGSSRESFSINTVRNIKTANLQRSNELNPQKRDKTQSNSNLYHQVKAKISKRYNNMFKKFTEAMKQQIKSQSFFKDICSARSLRRKENA